MQHVFILTIFSVQNLDTLKKKNVIHERTWEFHLVEDGFYSTLDEGNKGLAFIHVMGSESIYYIRIWHVLANLGS